MAEENRPSVAGAPSTTAKGGVAGGGKRPTGTGLQRIPGIRTMKEYPLTMDDMLTLGLVQGGSALFLAAAGACIGFWLSIQQTVDFADKDKAEKIAYWTGLGDAAFWLSIICLLIGLLLFCINGFKVWTIWRDTKH